MGNPFSSINFTDFFKQIPVDIIQKQNEKYLDKTDEDFKKFGESLRVGRCSLCGNKIEEISDEPCLHWLINENIKKKQLKTLLNSNFGFFSLYSYLVWCANVEKPFVNINDLKNQIKPNRHFESTIKYKIWEWSICIGKSDYEGHGSMENSRRPHFHLQIKKDGQIFFKFKDAHITFTNTDLQFFAMIEQGIMSFDPGYGAGLETLQEEDLQSQLPEWLNQSKNEETAHFRTQTLIDTQNLASEIFNEIMELHKETDMVIPAIIEKLKKEKGYNISYITRTIPNSCPDMQHRHQRGQTKEE